jgi:hypothetical protein
MYPMPIDVRAEIIHHFTGKLVLLPAIGVETKNIFALQVEAILKVTHTTIESLPAKYL